MLKHGLYIFKYGRLKISACNNFIHSITLTDEHFNYEESILIKEAKTQLDDFFNVQRFHFDLPLKIYGTNFQKMVWEEALKIHYGETVNYSDIAKRINNPNSIRAVGGALKKNPFLIVIPCHRVVSKNNGISGYVGGKNLKKWLIDLEKKSYYNLIFE